jgi:hypothetical protein
MTDNQRPTMANQGPNRADKGPTRANQGPTRADKGSEINVEKETSRLMKQAERR